MRKSKNSIYAVIAEAEAEHDGVVGSVIAEANRRLVAWQSRLMKLVDEATRKANRLIAAGVLSEAQAENGLRREVSRINERAYRELYLLLATVLSVATAAQRRLIGAAVMDVTRYSQVMLTEVIPAGVSDVIVGDGVVGPTPSGDGVVRVPLRSLSPSEVQSLVDSASGRLERFLLQNSSLSILGDGLDDRPVGVVAAENIDRKRSELLRVLETDLTQTIRDAHMSVISSNADLFDGWVWVARVSSCCGSCLAMHGTKHSLYERMSSHPHCKCEMIPVTIGWSGMSGADVVDIDYADMLANDRDRMMKNMSLSDYQRRFGKEKGQLLFDREIQIGDLVDEGYSTGWGVYRREASLRTIKGRTNE